MKSLLSIFSVLVCFVLAFASAGCEDKWSDETQMGYVAEIQDNGDGSCIYFMSLKPGGKSHDKEIKSSCGLYKIGEGFFIPQ